MLLMVLLAVCASAATDPDDTDGIVVDRVVAIVDRAIVLQSEVDAIAAQFEQAMPIPAGVDAAAVRRERRAQILDTLIAEKLLEAEVKKLRIDVTDAEVDRAIAGLMRDNGLTDETLKMALGRQGMNLTDFKAQKKKELTKMKIVQLKVRSRVTVTDDDVKTALRQQERASQSAGFTKVRARHILWLVPEGTGGEAQKRDALATRVALENGADFAELAAAKSEDPGSKSRGGDLGTFGRGEMVPEFEAAAFAAPLGKVVGPVRTNFGWHLIRVDEQLRDAPMDAEKASEALRNQLFGKELEAQFEQYLNELRRDAFIEKRL
jgi:peptidyl-prolyl cis-trans isomerase SurA